MKGKTLLYWIVVTMCAVGLAISGGALAVQWREYRQGKAAYATLAETAVAVSKVPNNAALARPDTSGQNTLAIEVDFDALEKINPDVVGWLYCPDTIISYPVVQGEDNEYYLDHLFDGTQNSAGCLFLDSRCEGLEGNNSIIYGHYIKNDTLFASLKEYQDQAYYEAHPRMFLITPESVWTIELFSAYITGTDGKAWQRTFDFEEEYEAWLIQLQENSCFDSSVTPGISDRVITLSTCSYVFQDARFVCHGLVREN